MKLKPVVASLVMLGVMSPVFAKVSPVSQAAVMNQNSVTSPVVSEGWFNRISVGGVGSVVGIVGNNYPAGSFKNSKSSSDLYVNNANLLVNADLSHWSKATLNLAYSGAHKVDRNFYVDEAYVTIANLAKSPFYFTAGKKYIPFGEYTDAYTPYQIMGLTQMLTQTNAPTAIAGVTSNFGFYASIFGLKGETRPTLDAATNVRNFGAKIGYHGHLDGFDVPSTHVNFSVSYLNNLWDTEFLAKHDNQVRGTVGGISAHADITYKAFSMSANFVSALKEMKDGNDSSRIWAADVTGDYGFKTFDLDSHFLAGFQWNGNVEGLPSIYTNFIPKWRLVGEYKLDIFKNTALGFVASYGKSFEDIKGKDKNAVLGLARLTFKF